MTETTPPQINQKLQIQTWWFTALLIAVNVGLFGWQILSGVNITDPAPVDAIAWGADFTPLTFTGEPERLFSSMFFHFGMIHLMLNMWALYIFGSVAEQLFGRSYYIGLYFLAGLMGSELSSYLSIRDGYELLQQFDPKLLPHISAGASGAVMGIGAALTVVSLFPPLPQQRFWLDKKSLLMIMGINLVFGFTVSGINNAAHIGGMIMGALLAATWYFSQKTQNKGLFQIIALSVGLLLLAAFYWYCTALSTGLNPLWHEILRQNQSTF
ncbi:rhomboid family intramembrane serine protease [Acinetobacter dispersus]|uniref:rhomboid family intramembrane serine protease n=1 Tax=Acinetobacter dispersus TaxID=70348 RepID=UPI00132EB208|nr:rhomboid family intramembrane serine protease [Acinetobacter dispersus]MCH7382318.1 rhomboid family intramembrane serine protease [Acinetobacter dispersus]QHH96101.1 rhomboid family intramembrane serine protease [Acinetobacter dispersus]